MRAALRKMGTAVIPHACISLLVTRGDSTEMLIFPWLNVHLSDLEVVWKKTPHVLILVWKT